MAHEELRRYRFGPLERRGLIGSLRPAQVFVIAASLAGAVVLLRSLSGGAGVFCRFPPRPRCGRILLLADRRPVCRGVAADRGPARAATRHRAGSLPLKLPAVRRPEFETAAAPNLSSLCQSLLRDSSSSQPLYAGRRSAW